jgi:uncharacterized protein (TIGR02145 family)
MPNFVFIETLDRRRGDEPDLRFARDPRRFAHGYLTDARDGHVYRTVRIGTQVWMAQNLEWIVDSSWIPSGDANSGAANGRLYNWPTAMGLDPSFLSTPPREADRPIRGICPVGWHIPSRAE